MKRFTLVLVFAVVALSGTTTPKSLSAQEILLEGPLAGAPAVRKLVQYREMRFSVGPQFSYTILNEYMHNFMPGLRLEFNFLDWLGIGIVGYYGINAPTKLTQHISDSRNLAGDPTTPTDSNWPSYTGSHNFEEQVARLKGVYLAQLAVVPFRGKMAMFEKLFVAIDGSIFVGGGIVHFEERTSCDSTANPGDGDYCGDINDPPTPTRETKIGGTFTLGIGFMAHFNNFVALNLEFRATPFKWNAGGTDEAGQAASEWKYSEDPETSGVPIWQVDAKGEGDYPNGKIGDEDRDWNPNLSIALGVIFYLPTTPRIGD